MTSGVLISFLDFGDKTWDLQYLVTGCDFSSSQRSGSWVLDRQANNVKPNKLQSSLRFFYYRKSYKTDIKWILQFWD